MTGCVTDYINFCVDTVVPQKTILCFPNNKPWVTKDIKATLNKKKRAFRNGDRDQLKLVQKELKAKIAEGKESYRQRLEDKLQENNSREVWNGMRAITGLRQKRGVGMDGDVESANNLNLHFNRFDCPASPASKPIFSFLLPPLLPPQTVSPCPSQQMTSKKNWANSTPAKLLVLMVSVPGPSGAVLPSCLEFYNGSSA